MRFVLNSLSCYLSFICRYFYVFTKIKYLVKMYLEGMIEMNKEMKNIPLKNYIILGVVLIGTLLLLYYFYMWVDIYKESKINIPIMDKYMDLLNYNELDNYLVENPNTIMYVSILDNEEIREFEKKFKDEFKEKHVNNKLLYLNITPVLNDKEIMSELNSKYYVNNLSITDVPCIVVFSSGTLKSIYSIGDNKYDINSTVEFINSINVNGRGL